MNIFTGHELSGQYRKQRQEMPHAKLLEGFEECNGREVEQSIIIHYLGLCDAEKSIATRAVTSTLPSCNITRKMKGGQN